MFTVPIDWLLVNRIFLGVVGVATIVAGVLWLIDDRSTALDDIAIAFLIMLAGMFILYGVFR